MYQEKYENFLKQMSIQNQEFVSTNQYANTKTPVYVTYNDNKTQNDNLRRLCRI